jgi:hypothetical protein
MIDMKSKGQEYQLEEELYKDTREDIKRLEREKESVMEHENLKAGLVQSQLLSTFPLVPPPPPRSQSTFSSNYDIKDNAVIYYENVAVTEQIYRCQLTGIKRPRKDITCSHIFQRSWESCKIGPDHTRSLFQLLGGGDINEAKNIIFLLKPIEVQWDAGKLLFEWNHSRDRYECVLLDESIDKEFILEDEDLTFGDLEGKYLSFESDRMPSFRLMAFRSIVNANVSKRNGHTRGKKYWDESFFEGDGVHLTWTVEERLYVLDWISKLED